MTNKLLYFLSLLLLVGFSSCDEEVTPVYVEAGGVTAQVNNVQTGFYNLLDLDNASIAFDLTTNGVDANSVTIFKSLNGGEPVEHAKISSVPSTITVSAADAVAGLGVSLEDLELGDAFDFTFSVDAADGRTLKSGNTLLNVKVSCASTLDGTYSAVSTGTSTDGCCPGELTVESEVTVTSTGGGTYSMSDFSGGLYFAWYEVYGITGTDDSPGNFEDVCNSITIINTNEPFQTAVTGDGTVDGDTGVITFTWVNGYGDTGTSVLTPM